MTGGEGFAPAVRLVIADTLGLPIGKVKPEHLLADDLGADSLDACEFWLAIEDTFEVAIPDEAREGMRTVGDVVDVVRKAVTARV